MESPDNTEDNGQIVSMKGRVIKRTGLNEKKLSALESLRNNKNQKLSALEQH